ncbi:DNA helicase-2/ATP-dependent DNA helicase PcrA [Virgibacillus natechei]|uniref:DNA helicase-2/ATP-dependent DNA helicase PcrA n=1 Tax=Virgibacillus natechei TaxID=1216297 RepID=A0ABS4IM08_9BACI|nr:RNA polymerase recycling motor HelD [Virgibacillus natechei]MBP1971331.1 DNA helicase-2/ATP-dependent DNA helicase PcrA [Virgibacillus natechei]UZD12934.1 UvrD-helicase domain-containing protein [Virgibacillus natechei]
MDERAQEQQRVDKIMNEIKTKEEKLYKQSKGLKEDVIEQRKTFWDDITVNMDEPDDVIETQESIKQQAALLSEKERFHGKVGERLKTLDRLKHSPYFGRIDFMEDSYPEKEAIYIGISSLMDKDDKDFLIYDWRAPISSLYYDSSTGRAGYRTRETTITGEVSLKRQFIIKHGVIEGMFDTGVTIGDQMLQQALGNNASTTMKSIVATIQKEQNQIIRNERSSLLVVQGVAGSGKTSAALQRIAYLMYRYREELNADNVVLFSPNPLFGSYISNVLPELGETNVRQMTFLNYIEKRLMDNFTVESPFKQMEYVLTQDESQDYPTRKKSMEYLASLAFKDLIDTYVEKINEAGLRFKRIAFRGETIVSKQRIYDYFYALGEEIAIPNKLELVVKWLLEEVRTQQKEELNKDWVMEKVELLDKEDYMEAYHQAEEQEDYGSSISDEEEVLRAQMVKRVFAPLKKRIRNLEFVNIPATYQALFTEVQLENAPKDWQEIAGHILTQLKERYLTWENATPYLYFQDRILGDTTDRSVRQLIIDEAQDYSAFQFAYIRHIFPYTRMTLLGDINQAIYTYAMKENPLLPVDHEENQERITLMKSYRSTKQIVEFTKHFAPGGEMIEPFNREGSKPVLIQDDIRETLLQRVKGFANEGYETTAIICKTLQESDEIAEVLQGKVEFNQINEETYTFEKGLLILPVYLAKGIEFDAVIIPNASEAHYGKESDRTLFYTACTRAMHALAMISVEKPCKFIEEAAGETYEVE